MVVMVCRGECGEQPVQVPDGHMGVRRPDPDVELHGQLDIDADGPEAEAGKALPNVVMHEIDGMAAKGKESINQWQ